VLLQPAALLPQQQAQAQQQQQRRRRLLLQMQAQSRCCSLATVLALSWAREASAR
jgi:predicted anti-sigma-YlaC factor YlaD